MARLSQLALVVALVFATSGLARAAAVIAADDCCEGCEHSDCPEESSDEGSEGCPLPCSECVCAAYIAPAIVAAAQVVVASAAGPALQPLAPDVHPEARFLPGVFRPPRSRA